MLRDFFVSGPTSCIWPRTPTYPQGKMISESSLYFSASRISFLHIGVPTARQKPGVRGFFYPYSDPAGTVCRRQACFPFGNANRPVRDAHMGRKYRIEAMQACRRYADMGLLSWFFARSTPENSTFVEMILPQPTATHIFCFRCEYRPLGKLSIQLTSYLFFPQSFGL
jgi:hypothetical protein